MAFTDKQIQEIEGAVAKFMYYHRPPADIRNKLDFGYRIEGQSVFLFEIRPRWDKPDEKIESPFAKTTFIKTKNKWKVYWLRGNLKWYPYDPPYVRTISRFFELVAEDKFHCFFG
ncbi:MAG: DUF3024 domain-containing protein [Chlorobi bacterium]|nr:DUF3024 domain-containing protein [Chlorobiota bacterium]